jgi:hypothetical protein
MSAMRRPRPQLRAALVTAAVVLATAPSASAYQTAPDSSGNASYNSVIRGIEPRTPGLSARVLGHDNLVALRNRSGRAVVVYGYSGDPYARLLPDGTVQLNQRSPAFYLNEYRFGDQRVPSFADARAPPRWRTMDHSGELVWHDHRIHVAKGGEPASDTPRDTLLSAYRIPLRIGSRSGAIAGDLYWVGARGGPSWQLFVLPPVLLVLLLVALDSLRRAGRARAATPITR